MGKEFQNGLYWPSGGATASAVTTPTFPSTIKKTLPSEQNVKINKKNENAFNLLPTPVCTPVAPQSSGKRLKHKV